jgi:nucleotide-binding universal stress UspA family protein
MNLFKRILVPLDGSAAAETALPASIALAGKLGSELILLHVLESPTPTFPGKHPEKLIAWLEDARRMAREQAERYLASLRATALEGDVAARAMVRASETPAEEILSVAAEQGADLIVMCARGQGAMTRCTLGGIADKVLRHGDCPVLFVRQAESATDAKG